MKRPIPKQKVNSKGNKPELNHGRENLQKIMDQSLDVICTFDEEGRFRQVSKACKQVWGYELEELIGKRYIEMVLEEDRVLTNEAAASIMSGVDMRNFENRYIRKDNSIIPLIWSARWDAKEKLMYAIARDASEKKATEEKIRVNDARLIKAQEIGKLGYWELERNSKMIWGSEKALEIFGFPPNPSEIPIEQVEACIPDIDKVRQAAMDLIAQDKKYEIEFLIHPADGSPEKHISAVAEIEEDKYGTPFKIVGIFQDITESKTTEKKLLKAYEEIASILASITDGFLTVDKNWTVKYWNKAAERIMGVNRENIIDKNLWEVYADAIPTRFYSEFNKAMNENISIHFEEYFPPLDIWFRLNIYPSKDILSIFFQDITENKRQERLEILEKETLEFYTSHKSSLEDMITFLLNGMQKIHPEMICSVLKIKDGKMYNWSSPQLPKAYNDEVEGLPIGLGQGSCGTAAYLREKVEVADISTHPFWKDYKEIAALYGLNACWSYPIIDSNQNLLGTFGIYFRKIRSIKKAEELTIERARMILINIIENKLAENALKAYKDQLELIYNTSTDVIFLLSIENENRYKFTTVNLPFLSTTDLKRSQVEGKYAEEVIPEPSRSFAFAKYQQAIQEGHTIFWEETTEYPSGKKTGIVSISPVFNEKNECIKLLGIVHDITERKKHEEEIRYSNKELKRKNEELEEKNIKLEDIAWIQSHKIRAPLTRIMGLVDLLTNYRTEEMDTNELLGYIVSSANELDGLIREIVEKTEQVKQPKQ
ncbi:MAG TPA: PAS domain S-box protein [Cytophagaceae bacterium]|jgi:PAS domain S-box-containing protein|nr:PAS domain S-box protein [Cytophagaceae bacterium]